MRLTVLKRTTLALAISLACFAVYRIALVPFLEPSIESREVQRPQIDQQAARPSDRYLTEVQSLLQSGSWETKTPKVLRYQNTLLLFDDYQPRENGTIVIRPCTVIMRQSNEATPEAINSSIVMRAPEGATLQLSKPLGFGTAELGEPLAGRLSGPIRISSRGRADGTGRFDVTTADVYIDRKLLQTTARVDLQFEGSRAIGQQLIVHLMPENVNNVPDRPTGWAGIRSIELVDLEHLRIDVSDDREKAAPVDVKCRGPLRIDFIENLMTLEEEVNLKRFDPSGAIDTLDCDRLEMAFDKQAKATTTLPTKPAKPDRPKRPYGATPKLDVTKVIAEGRPVVLHAASRNAHIRSRRLAYDLKHGRFQLWSNPEDKRDRVGIRIDENEFIARQLRCQLDEDGELIQVNARGPGQFSSSGTAVDRSDVMQAYWRDELVFKREEQELRHLTLVGDCWVAMNKESGIEAEVLHLWLEPTPEAVAERGSHPELRQLPKPLGVAGNNLAKKDANSPIDMSSLRPVELVALSSTPNRPNASQRPVVLTTDGVVGKTDRLKARFVHLPPDRTRPNQQQGAATTLISSRSDRSNANVNSTAGGNSDRASADAPRESATQIQGRNLAVTLEVRGKEVTVGDLKLDDQIQIRHFDLSKGDAPTFQLGAKEVQVRMIDGRQILTARGQPVQIRSDELRFLTTQLHVDQEQSVAWTNQPGRMEVLVDRDANGRKLAKPQTMTIDWDDGMTFDGRVANFKGQVEVVGPEQRLRASHVEVTLNGKVGPGSTRRPTSQQKLDIRRVTASGNVSLEAYEYSEADELKSVFLLRVPSVSFDRETGDLRASGPGNLTTIREGFQSAGFGQLTGSDEGRRGSREVDPAASRTFLRVDYQREANGNLFQRLIEFNNRVQVLYGPVGSFNEVIQPNGPLRKDDLFMTCDQLTVVQSSPKTGRRDREKNLFDLVARGNTSVEGQTFTAHGDQISYEQAKGQLILQGTGSTDAMLSHQARVGAPRSKTLARKILFWPETKRVEVDDARYLDLSNLGL